eukprot:4454143-Pyramimonas_sp.AAC.1
MHPQARSRTPVSSAQPCMGPTRRDCGLVVVRLAGRLLVVLEEAERTAPERVFLLRGDGAGLVLQHVRLHRNPVKALQTALCRRGTKQCLFDRWTSFVARTALLTVPTRSTAALPPRKNIVGRLVRI